MCSSGPGPPAVPPSPNVHRWVSWSPSGSLELELKLTVSGAVPARGVAATVTRGGWLPGGSPTVIVTVAVSNPSPLSVAVTVAV